jgi:dTDP-4-amino-4,6-dideoxygalactose transaminase
MEVGDACPRARDRIIEVLHAENILARKYFWPGCHNMKPYRELYPDAGKRLPNTRTIADRVVVLPTGQAMDVEMVKSVASVIRVLVEGSA